MRLQRAHSSGWRSYELCWKKSDGKVDTPVSSTLGNGPEPEAAIAKIQLVEAMGWPEAKSLMFSVGKGKRRRQKRRIVKKDDVIWELKCTPTCWRLYFYVKETDGDTPNQFIYVHAVCKQENAEDPIDAVTARQRYDQRRAGGCLFDIPENN